MFPPCRLCCSGRGTARPRSLARSVSWTQGCSAGASSAVAEARAARARAARILQATVLPATGTASSRGLAHHRRHFAMSMRLNKGSHPIAPACPLPAGLYLLACLPAFMLACGAWRAPTLHQARGGRCRDVHARGGDTGFMPSAVARAAGRTSAGSIRQGARATLSKAQDTGISCGAARPWSHLPHPSPRPSPFGGPLSARERAAQGPNFSPLLGLASLHPRRCRTPLVARASQRTAAGCGHHNPCLRCGPLPGACCPNPWRVAVLLKRRPCVFFNLKLLIAMPHRAILVSPQANCTGANVVVRGRA
jgi:hypothetical protein